MIFLPFFLEFVRVKKNKIIIMYKSFLLKPSTKDDYLEIKFKGR